MGSNTTNGTKNARRKPAAAPSAPNPAVDTEAPDLARRRLVKGAAVAAPVILTLRSGSALAQTSLFATPWSGGPDYSTVLPDVDPGQCAAFYELPDPPTRSAVMQAYDAQWPQPPTSGNCPTGYEGVNLDNDAVGDTCCPSGTVLVTASSATSLVGPTTNLTF